jgi:hypothetical protein
MTMLYYYYLYATPPRRRKEDNINSLNAKLNPICHLLALLGAHYILHVRRISVNTELQKVGWWHGLE